MTKRPTEDTSPRERLLAKVETGLKECMEAEQLFMQQLGVTQWPDGLEAIILQKRFLQIVAERVDRLDKASTLQLLQALTPTEKGQHKHRRPGGYVE